MRADYFPREDRKECSAPATAPEKQIYKRSAPHVDRNRWIIKMKGKRTKIHKVMVIITLSGSAIIAEDLAQQSYKVWEILEKKKSAVQQHTHKVGKNSKEKVFKNIPPNNWLFILSKCLYQSNVRLLWLTFWSHYNRM